MVISVNSEKIRRPLNKRAEGHYTDSEEFNMNKEILYSSPLVITLGFWFRESEKN